MNLSSTFWEISSFSDFHTKLIIKLIVFFKQWDQMLLDSVYRTVIRIIGDTLKSDVQRIFTKHCNQYQVLQII